MNIREHKLASALLFSSISYGILSLFVPGNIPLLVAVFMFSRLISNTPFLARFFRVTLPRLLAPWVEQHQKSLSTNQNALFCALSGHSQKEVLSALQSLHGYISACTSISARHRRLYALLSREQQRACDSAGYSKKLDSIDQLAIQNQKLLIAVADHAAKLYGVSPHEYESILASRLSGINYRVIESLSHFTRDWTEEGRKEQDPIWNYVSRQIEDLIPENERSQTCVVVPGSGLGYIAHSLATMGEEKFGAVYAVEFSGLMHLCNQYMYSDDEPRTIYPYIHNNLNHRNTKNQLLSQNITTTAQPQNLHLILGDFTQFSIPDPEKYKNVVVVCAFFIDTAENLMDYFDSVAKLAKPNGKTCLNGYWLNAGPLKYGSAARVELNAEEVAKARKKLGWKDVSTFNTVGDRADGETGLVDYITNHESMWQGFYGLDMWCAARKENIRQ